MPIDPTREKALFLAALELPDPLDRPGWLDRECGDDRESRERLDALLAAHDCPATEPGRSPIINDAAATLPFGGEGPTVELPRSPEVSSPTEGYQPAGPSPSPVGGLIAGRYKIRQEIGEGGMGSVYLADQLQPVKRQVALKLIKAGMDSRTVLARFESERQALALMDHPNIAKVLDAGTTDQGRPFFVMELVKGVPLTDYCDAHRLDVPARLALFRQVCSAVQHAHQKGIIHRDLKPTNILVEGHDGRPDPKVIDFGLAKATSGLSLTDQSLYTAFGSVTGTPLYMAPEQASFNALDVDTRADIYALGVILYELLTGTTPIRRDAIRRAAPDEMLRVIREDEPPTPSSRIGTSEGLPSIAANRHTEPARLSRFVRGDLDWIVMKALAKERDRRYESAIAFADDVERFTNHEPVGAGPPTSGYRLRKFIRRNRGRVIAASMVLLALVAGIVGTTLGLFEARRQQGIAIAEGVEKDKARQAEADQRREAERQLTRLVKANEILGSIFKDLDPSNQEKGGKPLAALLGERLDQATAQIEGEAIGDPLTVARMQQTLGESHLGLGYWDKAIGLFAKARATFTSRLGPDHPETLKSMYNLASGQHYDGRLDLALPLYERTLGLMKARLGVDHPDTLAGMHDLALGYRDVGQFGRALPLSAETLALRKAKFGPDHRDTLRSMGSLASIYHDAGQLDRALPLYEQTLALRKAKLGVDHPDTLINMNNLASAYRDSGRLDLALPLHEQTLALQNAKLGPVHPETLGSMNSLALAYQNSNKFDRALPLFERTLELMTAKFGPDHPETLAGMLNLARCYQGDGRLDLALPLYERTLGLMKVKLGVDHPSTLTTLGNLALAYQYAGRLDRALPLHEQAIGLTKAKLGVDHPSTLTATSNLALGYQANGRLDLALPLFEQTLPRIRSKMGPDHPNTLSSLGNLAACYHDAGQPDKELSLRRELVDLQKRIAGPESSPYAGALAGLGTALSQQKKWADAEPILREALAIRESKQADAWSTFNTKSVLGGALLGRKKYAEAGPLLRAGYEGLKQRADKIPLPYKARPAEALDRLIELAEATGKPDEAKAWRDEKAKLPVPMPGGKKP